MTDTELYHILFNAITDALQAIANQNYGEAKAILIAAQQQTEEAYLRRGETEYPALAVFTDSPQVSANLLHPPVVTPVQTLVSGEGFQEGVATPS